MPILHAGEIVNKAPYNDSIGEFDRQRTKETEMIKGEITIRPRYSEVDQMGYVYHANYVTYCHQARTELLRKLGIEDRKLESQQIMMPVISMNLQYHSPAHYDETVTVTTRIKTMPNTRFTFNFEFKNQGGKLICTAESTVVFVNSETRKPLRAPDIVLQKLNEHLALSV